MNFILTRKYLISCVLLVTAAWNQNMKTEANRPFDLSGTIKKHFALLSALVDQTKSTVCSPVSIYLLLGKLSLGAESPTIEELKLAIGIFSKEEMKVEYRKLINELILIPPGVTINISVQLFLDKKLNIINKFCQDVLQVFVNCARKVDFSKPHETSEIINHWVSKQTNKLITSIVTPSNMRHASPMIMISTVYFSGTWKTSFNEVNEEYFFDNWHKKYKVNMMYLTTSLNYMYSDIFHCHIVEIPYTEDAASFILVMPKFESTLPTVIANMYKEPDLLRAEMLKMEPSYVRLKMPKFKIESTKELNPYLMALGLKSMFNKVNSGLNKITSEKLHVAKVFQKVFIEVTELGTKAAAATAINMAKTLIDFNEVVANRPFLFYIKSHGHQLFSGVYNGPE